MAPESGGNEQNLASLVQFLSWNSKQLMQKSSLNFDKYCLHLSQKIGFAYKSGMQCSIVQAYCFKDERFTFFLH